MEKYGTFRSIFLPSCGHLWSTSSCCCRFHNAPSHIFVHPFGLICLGPPSLNSSFLLTLSLECLPWLWRLDFS
jgi:hypothetical protein